MNAIAQNLLVVLYFITDLEKVISVHSKLYRMKIGPMFI